MSRSRPDELVVRLEFKDGPNVDLVLPRTRIKQLTRNPSAFRFKQREREEIARQLAALTGQHQKQSLDLSFDNWRARVRGILLYARSRAGRHPAERLATGSGNVSWTLPWTTRVVKPPGSTLLMLAEYCLSPKTRERIVIPIIRDMRDEYYDALDGKRPWLARAIWARGVMAFVTAIAAKLALVAVLKWLGLPFANGKNSSP